VLVFTPFAVVTLIVVVPGETAVATPLALIVATPVLLLSHVKVVLVTLLEASRAVAVKACVEPTTALAGSGEIETVVAGFGIAGQIFVEVALLRGAGAPVLKSADRVPVNVQPPLLRIAAVVLLSVAVVPNPQLLALVPKLTSSTIAAPVGHVVAPKAAVVFERKTLPVVADIEIPPVASGVGRGVNPDEAPPS
jgi:hypothetical protein